jgi:hypothetical protein
MTPAERRKAELGSFTAQWAGEHLAPHALVRLAECPADADLGDAASLIEQLRISLLFDRDTNGLDDFAEQQALIALSLLEQAQHHMRIAAMEQARAIATRGGT